STRHDPCGGARYQTPASVMLSRNHLLVYRAFTREQSPFPVNVDGLTARLTGTLFLYLWVDDELSVDRFNAHDDRVYQLMLRGETASGIEVSDVMAPILAETVAEEFPEVEYAVMEARLPITYTLLANDKVVKE